MKPNRVWVIEMWNDESGRWEPTADAQIDREAARYSRSRWIRNNPDDKFRVCKYVATTFKEVVLD